jgi:hypothetical protein
MSRAKFSSPGKSGLELLATFAQISLTLSPPLQVAMLKVGAGGVADFADGFAVDVAGSVGVIRQGIFRRCLTLRKTLAHTPPPPQVGNLTVGTDGVA